MEDGSDNHYTGHPRDSLLQNVCVGKGKTDCSEVGPQTHGLDGFKSQSAKCFGIIV